MSRGTISRKISEDLIKQPPARISNLYAGHKIALSISIPIDLYNQAFTTFLKAYEDHPGVHETTTSSIFCWLIHQGMVRLMEIFPEKFKAQKRDKTPR